jgi:hypothetical protein
MTTTTPAAAAAAAAKKKAPSKPKAPILLAERSLAKQITAIQESALDQRVKVQVVDWLVGIRRTLQLIEQVVDADNPPPANGAHGQLIAIGRSQRTLDKVLSGVIGGADGEDDDEDGDEDPPNESAPLADPKAAAAALAARQRTPASIGV